MKLFFMAWHFIIVTSVAPHKGIFDVIPSPLRGLLKVTGAAPVSFLASRKEAIVSRKRGASAVQRLSSKKPTAVDPVRSDLKTRFPRTTVAIGTGDWTKC